MADMKTLTLGGKTFNIMDAEARAKAIPTVQVGGDTLTWDGNTEGKEPVFVGGEVSFYKVDDAAPVLDDCQNGLSVVFGGEVASFTYDDLLSAAEEFGTLGTEMFLSIPYNNFSVFDAVFPEKGTYFIAIDGAYVSSLTIPGYTGFGEKKIDPAYLYQPDWNQNDPNAPDYIKNKRKVLYVNFEDNYLYTDADCTVKATASEVRESMLNIIISFMGTVTLIPVMYIDTGTYVSISAIIGEADSMFALTQSFYTAEYVPETT